MRLQTSLNQPKWQDSATLSYQLLYLNCATGTIAIKHTLGDTFHIGTVGGNMKRRILNIVLIILLPMLSAGQMVDSLTVLHELTWVTGNKWFGNDTVVMKPTIILDTTSLDEVEKARCLERNMWGERIGFDDSGILVYTYRLPCPVGELLYDLKTFEFDKGKVGVKYAINTWSGKLYKEGEAVYSTKVWSDKEIVLVKIEK